MIYLYIRLFGGHSITHVYPNSRAFPAPHTASGQCLAANIGHDGRVHPPSAEPSCWPIIDCWPKLKLTKHNRGRVFPSPIWFFPRLCAILLECEVYQRTAASHYTGCRRSGLKSAEMKSLPTHSHGTHPISFISLHDSLSYDAYHPKRRALI